MKPVNIILIGIGLFFIVIYGKELVAMLAKGNCNSAVIFLLAIMLNAIAMLILIRKK